MTIKTWEDRDYEAKCAELEIAQGTLKNLWARVAELEAELTSSRDMANVGEELMQAVKAHADAGWHPSDCPSEIVGDLRNQRDELKAELAAIRAHSPEGPLLDGWQITLSDGHTGYGVYAHMTEYPDEGAIFLLSAGAQPVPCPRCAELKQANSELARAAIVPEGMALVPDAVKQDAARYQWLTADLSTSDGRVERNELLSRMSVMSYSAASRDIDAAMLQAAKEPK